MGMEFMELLVIIIASAVASLITLFSGFGLGTLLMPVFALFFPVEIAIALTGVVHFFNNIFKLGLLGKHAQWSVVLRFGIPSVVGALLGAWILLSMTDLEPVARYSLFGATYVVQPIKLIIAVVMITFAFVEMFPKLQSFTPSARTLPFGGLLSGFFGGLSGHQGALRSAFLIRYGMSKEQFLATGVVIACFVDFTRLSIYFTQFAASDTVRHWEIVVAAVASAFIGAYLGNKMLKKVTLAVVQKIVAVMLFSIAVALGAGLI
jgi:hypothetical protein